MSNRLCTVPKASEDPDEPGFKFVDSAIPDELPNDHVLLKVLVCGVCHSDTICVRGKLNGPFPAVPGHEVIGKVVKVAPSGAIAQTFAEGTIVGIGWHGDHCLSCEACSDGDFVYCENQKICGIHFFGGYQEYMVAPAKGLARVPKGMDPITAAPFMCAGVTVFNGLRRHNDKAIPPALLAVVGIGGLGHLAIQYAAKLGYTVVAISRGMDKKEYSMQLGATHFIDSKAQKPSEGLKALGGAKIILCTGINSKAMADCMDGLARNGKLVVLGIDEEPIPVQGIPLIMKRCSIVGNLTGSARDSQDTMEFAQHHGIVPKLVVFEGIDKAPEAYAAMMKGEYRVVLKIADE